MYQLVCAPTSDKSILQSWYWYHNIWFDCELCQEKDDINHLLINCSLAKSVWQRISGIFLFPLDANIIILGTSKIEANYVISFIAFIIYKYWLISFKDNKQRSVTGLYSLIKSELTTKARVYNILKKENISILLQIASNCF